MNMLDLGIYLEYYSDIDINKLIVYSMYPNEKERLWILYNREL